VKDLRNGFMERRHPRLFLCHATRTLFETLCFSNGLGGRRGKERDHRSSGVSLTAAGNNARGELGVVLNRRRQRANEFDAGLSQDFADLIEADLNVAVGTLAYSTFPDGDSVVLGFISPAMPNRSSKLAR
jgi:hypothetical protein